MSLHPKYPNLELLEYKTIQFLYSDQNIKQALEDWKQEHMYFLRCGPALVPVLI